MKIVHTADWQIGMLARHAAHAAEKVREARLSAAANVVELCARHGADALLLAGDTFEDNAVDPVLVRRVAEILRRAPCPVLVLPGNHDPLGPGSVFEQPVWREVEPRVQVLRSRDPVKLGSLVFLPCPCDAKYSADDPTRRIPPRSGGFEIRVGIAHGTLLGRGLQSSPDGFPIAADAAERAQLDYLALGHLHSTYAAPSLERARVAYSGTHEPTKFGEADSGNVLLVHLDAPEEPARVEKLATGVLTWVDLAETLDGDDAVARLRARLAELTSPASALLRLELRGVLSRVGFAGLDELETMVGARGFLSTRIDRRRVIPRPDDAAAWVAVLPDGIARKVAERLLAQMGGETPEREREVAVRALSRLVTMAGGAS